MRHIGVRDGAGYWHGAGWKLISTTWCERVQRAWKGRKQKQGEFQGEEILLDVSKHLIESGCVVDQRNGTGPESWTGNDADILNWPQRPAHDSDR